MKRSLRRALSKVKAKAKGKAKVQAKIKLRAKTKTRVRTHAKAKRKGSSVNRSLKFGFGVGGFFSRPIFSASGRKKKIAPKRRVPKSAQAFFGVRIRKVKVVQESRERVVPPSQELVPPTIPSRQIQLRPQVTLVAAPSLSPLAEMPDFGAGPRFLKTTQLLRPEEGLKQSIEGFLLDQRSPHTRRAYGKDLKRFIQFLIARKQDKGIERIDRLLIIAYKDSLLSEGLEHTSVDRHLATLRSFFRWLVDDGKIEKSPAEGVRFLNPKKLSTTIGFSDEEVRKVLAIPDHHTRIGALHHAALSVLFYCGLRRSELCSLRTSNVSTERNHPILRLRGKGNAERLIVIPPSAWASLTHYLKISRKDLREDQFLFTPIRNNRGGGELNKGLDPSMIFYIVTKYSKLAGIANRVSPHSCRATAISNARDHQVADRAIQEFAGWASPDMITRYDKRKNAVENSASLSIKYGRESPTENGEE